VRFVTALLSLALFAASAPTPSITGTWQCVVDGPTGKIRRVMEITKSGDKYNVSIHSIDETDVPIVTHNVRVNGSNVTMIFDMNTDPWSDYHRVYRANLNPAGSTMTGTWSGPYLQNAVPMSYQRVAHATWPVLNAKATMVDVGANVHIEALDWGGSGRSVVLLAGLGNTGHGFIGIIPALTRSYHVYSVTRRGFGASSKPAPTAENYSANRLGDDVIAVLNKLKIDRPILIGHSIAGEELSDIGTRYPNRVAGLVYLDAGYWYAFDPGIPNNPAKVIPTTPPGQPTPPPVATAVMKGTRSFRGPINVPILAIFAYPHDAKLYGPTTADRAEVAKLNAEDAAQIAAFEKRLPTATVIRIPYASHYIYISNRDEVVRDINAFIAKLPG